MHTLFKKRFFYGVGENIVTRIFSGPLADCQTAKKSANNAQKNRLENEHYFHAHNEYGFPKYYIRKIL